MLGLHLKLSWLSGLLVVSCSALEVTPSSSCASVCIDNIMNDPTDADSSSTSSSDIVCTDHDFNSTETGKKFKECLTCLQTSDDSSGGETDQNWFLYNLRYAVDSCLYGFSNSSLAIETPCVVTQSCSTLKETLEDDNLDSDTYNTNPYSYCSANGTSLVSNELDDCVSCLREMSDEGYLANFLVALEAGCEQRPTAGTMVGLNQTIFSSTLVAITTPIVSTASTATSSSTLSKNAIIGIVIGGVVFLLVVSAVVFICIKKRRNTRSLASNYDAQYGSKTISSPLKRAYISPQGSPPFDVTPIHHYNSPSSNVGAHKGTAGEYYDLQAQKISKPYDQEIIGTTVSLPHHKAYRPNRAMSSTSGNSAISSPTTTLVSNRGERESCSNPPRSSNKRNSPNQPAHIRILSVSSSVPGFSQDERDMNIQSGRKQSFGLQTPGTGQTVSSNATTLRSDGNTTPYSGYSHYTPANDGLRSENLSNSYGRERSGSNQTYGERMLGLGNRTMPGGRPQRAETPPTPIQDSPSSAGDVEQWPGSM